MLGKVGRCRSCRPEHIMMRRHKKKSTFQVAMARHAFQYSYHDRVRELLPTFTLLQAEPRLPTIHSASMLTPSPSHQTRGIILLQDAARSNNLNEKNEKQSQSKIDSSTWSETKAREESLRSCAEVNGTGPTGTLREERKKNGREGRRGQGIYTHGPGRFRSFLEIRGCSDGLATDQSGKWARVDFRRHSYLGVR